MNKQAENHGVSEVLDMLRQDHQKVKGLFGRFEAMQKGPKGEDPGLVREIGKEIMVHAALEEELFYPAAADCLKEERLVDEALVEHQAARHLVEELAIEAPEKEMWSARVHVLGEYVAHHIDEEEKVIFPKLQQAGFGDSGLAQRMLERRKKLLAQAESLDLRELATLAGPGGSLHAPRPQ